MAEKPVPDNDPLVNKSMASWYVITLVILMVSLLWALWDEDHLCWQDRISHTYVTPVEDIAAPEGPATDPAESATK